jgi:hypothetical protein
LGEGGQKAAFRQGDKVMNKLSVSIRTKLFVCAFAVAALVFASQAFAQGTDVKVNVPFAFETGSQHFPAGTYMIRFESNHVMLLQGPSTSGLLMTISAETLNPAKTGKVVFQRYGDRYFLRQVWVAGSTIGSECVKSREEKQVQIALQKANATNVQLTLNASH